tara:strand:+ start:3712 stop:4959 length:1248 start_codon:yes stop_codon:yes gene_type:complete
MQIIKPVTVTNAILTSSTVPETDYAEWNAASTYAVGDKVIVIGVTHKIFESLTAGNINQNPVGGDGTQWLTLGATNRWKAFDQKIADQVIKQDSINYVFGSYNSNVTSLALFNLLGISTNVTVTDADLLNTTYAITVATGTRYDGSTGNVFVFDASSRPTVTFRRGNTYIFTQSASSNVGHQIAIRQTSGTAWTSGVTTTGTLGTDSVTTFVVPNNAPDGLQYYCVTHGINMGNDITVKGAGEVYNTTVSLIDNRNIVDWFTYFFEDQVQKETAQFIDIPPYRNAAISVTVTANTGEDAKLGQIVFGYLTDIGATTYGTSISIEDFSRKETDAFGNFIVVQRAFSQLADFDVEFETPNARRIQRTLAGLRAVPVVYIGSNDTAYGTTIYGFYRRFDLTLETPSLSFGAIEVEGLT